MYEELYEGNICLKSETWHTIPGSPAIFGLEEDYEILIGIITKSDDEDRLNHKG